MIPFPRWDVRTFRAIAAAVLCALAGWAVAAWAVSAQADASVPCSLFASSSGSDSNGDGSQSNPFGTAQHLVSALSAGQTGCLMSGTYSQSPGLSFPHAGSAGAPITLSSAPGQTATLTGGYVYMPIGSDYITVEDLNINGSATTQASIQIFGSHDALINDNVTNGGQTNSCIIMGFPGWTPYPTGTLIEDNVIHGCGASGSNQYHAIYFSMSQNATVTNNIIWGSGAFALHIYPGADGNTITHNVIDDNGYGVIFGGDGSDTSNNNTVEYNVVSGSSVGYNVSQSYGGTAGTGNTYANNCDYDGSSGDDIGPVFSTATPGFTVSGAAYGNPQFVNEPAHTIAGYELGSGSPCRAVVGYDTASVLAGDTSTTTTPTTPTTTTPPATPISTAPVAVTTVGKPVSPIATKLNGRVRPNGHVTSWRFQYGASTMYAASTRYRSVTPRRALVAASMMVSGLRPGSTYHFRLVAKWSNGAVTYGADHTFRTR